MRIFANYTHRPSDIRPGIREHDLSRELESLPGVEISIGTEVAIGDTTLRFTRRSGGYIGVDKIDQRGIVLEQGKKFEFVPTFSFTEPLQLKHCGKAGLLVLSRKVAESIAIDGWKIHVAEISGGKVKLAIEAPKDLAPAFREEILDLDNAPNTVSLVGFDKEKAIKPAEIFPEESDPKPFPGFIQILEIKDNTVRLGLSFDSSASIRRVEGEKVQGLVLARNKDEKISFPSHKPNPDDIKLEEPPKPINSPGISFL